MVYINENRIITNDEWNNIILKLGVKEKLIAAKRVVIKPNFAAGTYVNLKSHVMTDRELLRSTIEFIHSVNQNTKIYIAEADSTGYGYAFLKFEHLDLPQSLNLPEDILAKIFLLDMSRDRLERIEDKSFIRYINIDSQLWLSTTLINADFVINLSNLKTHTVTGYTGACKNLFGCLPDVEKYHNHPFIHQTIHDLVLAIKPDLCVVDAFYGMEKNGPVQGVDIDTGYRVFSNDPIEADIYATTTIGYNPRDVKYLRLLCKTSGRNFDTEAKLVKKYHKATKFVRIMNGTGLLIQRIGLAVENFGHRIHTCHNIVNLVITIARPMLLKLFGYKRLKAWKRKLLK